MKKLSNCAATTGSENKATPPWDRSSSKLCPGKVMSCGKSGDARRRAGAHIQFLGTSQTSGVFRARGLLSRPRCLADFLQDRPAEGVFPASHWRSPAQAAPYTCTPLPPSFSTEQEYILGYYTPSLSTPSPSPHSHSPPPLPPTSRVTSLGVQKDEIYKLFQSATCDNYLCCTRTLAAVVVSWRGSIK